MELIEVLQEINQRSFRAVQPSDMAIGTVQTA